MAIEVARANVALVPTFKGVSDSITREMRGVSSAINSQMAAGASGAGANGRSAGSQWRDSFGRALKGIGGLAIGAVALATAGLAAAIASYIPEAIAASDATDKFKSTLNFAGLGSSEIDALIQSTRKYADETVYSLSDIQSITAQLASNGVEGFDSLAEAAGNLNAVAGGNAETFGRVGQVLTQTAGLGKLTTENWNQLSEAIPGAAGPLMTALADAGAYTGNFREAMEAGEITAGEFNAALMELGMTDVAREAATSTSTMEGAFGGLQAAIVGSLGDAITEVKPGLTDLINTLAELAGPALSGLSSVGAALSPIFSGIAGMLSGANLSGLGDMFSGLSGMLGPLSGALLPLLKHVPMLANSFKNMTGPIGIAIGFITQMIIESDGLRAAFGDTFKVLGEMLGALSPIFGALGGVMDTLGGEVGALAGTLGDMLGDVISQLLPLFQAITPLLSTLAMAVVPILKQALAALAPIFGLIGEVVAALMPIITSLINLLLSVLVPVIKALMPVVSKVFGEIAKIIGAAVKVIQAVIKTVTAAIRGDWRGAWEGIKSIVTSVMGLIRAVISGTINSIRALISAGLSSIRNIWNSAWSSMRSALSGIWSGIASRIRSGLSTVTSAISGLRGRILGAVGGAGRWLWGAGRSIIDGFVNGIKSAFQKVRNALSSLTNMLPDWKGPAERDRVILRDSGRLVIDGFVDGLEAEYGSVEQSLRRLTSSLAGAVAAPKGVGVSMPDRITLVDADGSILSRAKVIAGEVVSGEAAGFAYAGGRL